MKKLFFLLIAVVPFSCKKESLYEQSRDHCKENVILTCAGELTDHYFKGTLNGKEFCVSAGLYGYWEQNVIGGASMTSVSDPTFDPQSAPTYKYFKFGLYPPIMNNYNGLTQEFAPFVTIQTPYVPNDTIPIKDYEFFEKFIKEGDLELRDATENRIALSGYNFNVAWSCVMLPGYEHYLQKSPERIPSVGAGITPSTGKQKNLVFRVAELKKTSTDDLVEYEVTFEISCDLYYQDGDDNYRYYGRLENGTYKTMLTFAKEG